ncbi:MAG: TetR/AcrR family transcriptional regulator C-terminal domain-containing protein [Stenotrophobium sp.]
MKPAKHHSGKRAPGRPKDLDKRAAILQSAKQLFARNGYAGVSMDAIAREAHVSKITLYSHFSGKESLFQTAVAEKCQDYTPPDFFDPASPLPLDQRLRTIGKGFMALLMSQEVMEFYRMLVAQGGDGAHLGKLFFAAGPARNLAQLSHLLDRACDMGELRIADTHIAAGHFFALLQGQPHMRALIGETAKIPPHQLRAHVEDAVELFLNAYRR